MGLLDFPMKEESSFIMHYDVLKYLDQFADAFDLRRHIKFDTKVELVQPKNNGWEVTHSNGKELFDFVLICNGHFSKPSIPEIENSANFKGQIMHSRDYKVPEYFKDKNVVIFGCGPSGVDILLEIADHVGNIALSMRNPPLTALIPSKDETGFENCDIILLCTGYEYEIPFLHKDCGLEIRSKLISPLYLSLINVKRPTMALIGLPVKVMPFIVFDAQVKYYLNFLLGKVELIEEIGSSHYLGPLQWSYLRKLGFEEGKLELLRKIYEKVAERRNSFPNLYKNDVISIVDGDFFIREALE